MLGHSLTERDRQLAPLLHERRWDTIAARMARLMDRAAGELMGDLQQPVEVGGSD